MEEKRYSIKDWPVDEKPREKLLKSGEHTLSDTELLAILLRTGVKGESALDLARKVLQKFGSFRKMSHTDIRLWKEFKGLGDAKICQIKAALEIGRRFRKEKLEEREFRVGSAKDVADMLMPRLRDLKKEVFKVLHLDSRNRVLDIAEAEEGTVNQANPLIREIFHKALQTFSTAIICVHNHPSGDCTPSREDKEFTRELVEAGRILHVKVLDHVIIGGDQYFSFADANLL